MKKSFVFLAMLFLALGMSAQTAKDYFHKGAQEYIFGKKQEAIQSVQQGLEIAPNDPELRELYEILMKEEENKQNQDNQDQNQDEQKKDDQQQEQEQQQDQKQNEQQQKQQQTQPSQISKEDLEKLLQALQMEEEKLQKDLQKRKAKVVKRTTEKDW